MSKLGRDHIWRSYCYYFGLIITQKYLLSPGVLTLWNPGIITTSVLISIKIWNTKAGLPEYPKENTSHVVSCRMHIRQDPPFLLKSNFHYGNWTSKFQDGRNKMRRILGSIWSGQFKPADVEWNMVLIKNWIFKNLVIGTILGTTSRKVLH